MDTGSVTSVLSRGHNEGLGVDTKVHACCMSGGTSPPETPRQGRSRRPCTPAATLTYQGSVRGGATTADVPTVDA